MGESWTLFLYPLDCLGVSNEREMELSFIYREAYLLELSALVLESTNGLRILSNSPRLSSALTSGFQRTPGSMCTGSTRSRVATTQQLERRECLLGAREA